MDFVRHPWIKSGYLQTILGILPMGKHPNPDDTWRIKLEDNDELLAHFHLGTTEQNRTVIMAHGLGGDANSPYLLRLSRKLTEKGVNVLRLNHRGCGEGHKQARHIYHAGRGEDILSVIRYMAEKRPNDKIYCIGFSLSANMLLHLLGSSSDRLPKNFAGALAISPPVDLESCSLELTKPKNFVFDRYFAKLLFAEAKKRIDEGHSKEKSLFSNWQKRKRMNMRWLDTIFTAPLGGFSSRDEYYQKSSSKFVLSKIKHPTLVVCADDDPMIPKSDFKDLNWSSTTKFMLTSGGGHMGFLQKDKTEYGDYRWMDRLVLKWLDEHLSNKR